MSLFESSAPSDSDPFTAGVVYKCLSRNFDLSTEMEVFMHYFHLKTSTFTSHVLFSVPLLLLV